MTIDRCLCKYKTISIIYIPSDKLSLGEAFNNAVKLTVMHEDVISDHNLTLSQSPSARNQSPSNVTLIWWGYDFPIYREYTALSNDEQNKITDRIQTIATQKHEASEEPFQIKPSM